MSKPFHCSLVTPERAVFDGEVSYADVPAHDGQFGVMANHAPLLAQLGTGNLKLTLPDDSHRSFRVEGGFAQVNANRLTIVSEKTSEA